LSAPNLVEFDRRPLLRRRWVRRLIAVLVLCALGAAVWLVGFSEVLGVRTVTVEGGDAALRRHVRAAVAIPPGKPMARVDVEAVATRVSTAVPTVREIEVERRWPSTVTVTVAPRVPVLAMRAGLRWTLLDEDGVVVDRQNAAPALPVLTRAGAPRAVVDAAAVVAALPKKLHHTVRTVTASTADSITLHTKGGLTVIWGSQDESDRKARVLAALLRHKAKVYDVSSPDLPTTRG